MNVVKFKERKMLFLRVVLVNGIEHWILDTYKKLETYRNEMKDRREGFYKSETHDVYYPIITQRDDVWIDVTKVMSMDITDKEDDE